MFKIKTKVPPLMTCRFSVKLQYIRQCGISTQVSQTSGRMQTAYKVTPAFMGDVIYNGQGWQREPPGKADSVIKVIM